MNPTHNRMNAARAARFHTPSKSTAARSARPSSWRLPRCCPRHRQARAAHRQQVAHRQRRRRRRGRDRTDLDRGHPTRPRPDRPHQRRSPRPRRPIAILIDFVHVLEYLWKAAGLHRTQPGLGSPTRPATSSTGHATRVAGRTTARPHPGRHRPAPEPTPASAYLTAKQPYLDYPIALPMGWPIATGVIEGACRYLVKDRLDITGARWSLPGAEAILLLRAVITATATSTPTGNTTSPKNDAATTALRPRRHPPRRVTPSRRATPKDMSLQPTVGQVR